MRASSVERVTSETSIRVLLEIDGPSEARIDTGVGFFDHMLDAFVRHGCFGADIEARGDVQVDDHHTVEDVGIAMGRAFREALGDKRGIRRFGTAFVPMDESLVMACVDISGRGQAFYEVDPGVERIGSFDAQLAKEFFVAFAREAGVTLHMWLMCGENGHHIVEAAFKACARALREAAEADPRVEGIPSTKGAL